MSKIKHFFFFHLVRLQYTYLREMLVFIDGRMEEVLMDKITSRIEKLCHGLNMDFIDPVIITCTITYYRLVLSNPWYYQIVTGSS